MSGRLTYQKNLSEMVSDFLPRGNNDEPNIAPEGTIPKNRIPPHQRFYCWELRRKQDLIDSIYKGYSIGVIISTRRVENNVCYEDIQDGQQRLTTLWYFANNQFSVNLNGHETYFKDLSDIQLRTWYSTTISWESYTLSEDEMCEMFHRINSGKSLTDNEKYYSRIKHIPILQFIQSIKHRGIKYIGSIGEGKTRGGLSEFIGGCLGVLMDNSKYLNNSYSINCSVLTTQFTEVQKVNLKLFLKKYYELLDELTTQIQKPKNKMFCKLTSIWGLATLNWIETKTFSDSLKWFISKKLENIDYVPTSFNELAPGERRNCQDGSIKKRLIAIDIQYNKDDEDEGGNESDSS